MSTQKNLREKFINAGVNFIDADTVYLSDDTKIGTGATIEPFVIIGREVKIASGAIIKGFTHLEQCVIDSGASVGPFARIRGNSHLKANAHVGNFVELKNTTLESGVKSGHLTYLGDAEVGMNTNIGAGTITCNYDGHNKFKTTIGKNCFIGSNTLIIAPAVIGDGALTATGTVVTHDIAPNALAISRAELKELPKAATRYHKKREKK